MLDVVVDVLPLEGVPILDEEDEDDQDNEADENASATQADAVPNEQARAQEHQANRAEAARQNTEYAFLRQRIFQRDRCKSNACMNIGVDVQIRGCHCC